MSKIGVLIETENDGVKATNFGVITAACAGGQNEVTALFLDGDAGGAAEALGQYGAAKAVQVSAGGTDLAQSPDSQAQALGEAVNHFELDGLLTVASIRGRDLLARLAARTGAALALDCVGIDWDAGTVTKSHFSGKTVATLKLEGTLFLCGVRPNAIEPVEAARACETSEFEAAVADPALVEVVAVKAATSDKIDLTEANAIITGGRPIGSAENYALLEECAKLIGAAVGASRAAVDAGYAPHSMQVGQTGKTVSPKLYIGCGLSGSVQHFAGMKTSKVIVAINTDKDAPIFGKCDYGIIGDLFEVVPVLTKVLKEQTT